MIQFFSEEIPFNVPHPCKKKAWIQKVVQQEGRKIDSIVFIFCSDDFLSQLNLKYLKHKTLTDIITFDYGSREIIAGEIYISIDRVKENTQKFNESFDRELSRVMIHGVLHLMGYQDKTPRQKSMMRKKEDACLSLL